MEEALEQLGLNEKEAKFYLYLLESGSKTASQISEELQETRTNTYMVLKKLEKEKLVEIRSSKVQKYSAADPERLKHFLAAKQQALRQKHTALTGILPELSSMYRLHTHKPGVVYLEGIKGFKAFLEDIYRAEQPVSLLASDSEIVPESQEAWSLLEKETRKRGSKGISTRAIFHTEARGSLDKKEFEVKGFEVRFWGSLPLEGEVVVYGDKIAFTVYKPALIVTVITNEVLAETFLTIFDQLWAVAKV